MPAERTVALRAQRSNKRPDRHRGAARLHIGRQSLDLRNAPATAADSAPMPKHLDVTDVGPAAIASRAQGLLATLGKQPVEVRLASGWCRLMLLPWNAQLTNSLRWQNYARARFEESFGEDCEAWDLQLASDLPGRDCIAVAWPAALRVALTALPAVRSVRVDLLERMGELIGQHPAFSGCLAEIDAAGASLLLIVNGRLRRIRTCHFERADALVSALRAEWASLDAAEEEVPTEPLALALASPPAGRDGARTRAIASLSAELGFGKTILLPAWT
jgi:hypothetical protein